MSAETAKQGAEGQDPKSSTDPTEPAVSGKTCAVSDAKINMDPAGLNVQSLYGVCASSQRFVVSKQQLSA